MSGFIVLKRSGETEQPIALNALYVRNAIFAEEIQPIHGTMIGKSPCFATTTFNLF